MCKKIPEEYFYRFLTLSEEQLTSLKQACPAILIESRWNEKNEGYVVCVPLGDEQSHQGIQGFLETGMNGNVKHGIYVSLVTDNDQAGFSVPDCILKLLRQTKGAMDVSFTVV